MIQIISIVVQIWICAIPVAGIVFGIAYRSAPPPAKCVLRQRAYIFWCVAWPFALLVMGWFILCDWSEKR